MNGYFSFLEIVAIYLETLFLLRLTIDTHLFHDGDATGQFACIFGLVGLVNIVASSDDSVILFR